MVRPREAKLNLAPAQDNAPLFCRPLPAVLETRILEQLEPNVLAICRLVNSRWRDAVDELNSRWCALFRRIAVHRDYHQSPSAVSNRSCHELPKTSKTVTNDCWMGCDLCPVEDSNEPPLSDLQLANVVVVSAQRNRTLFEDVKIKVAAFDGASAKYYSWVLRLTGTELDFWSFLNYYDLFAGRNLCEWTALVEIKADTWKSLVAGGLQEFLGLMQLMKNLKIWPLNQTGGRDESLNECKASEQEYLKSLFEKVNNAILKLFDLSSERLREYTEFKTDLPIEPCLFAVLPLNRTPSGRVRPQCFITMKNRDELNSVATHRCQSCSETQLLVLSCHQLHLYSLPYAPEFPYPDAEKVPPILPPVVTIDFRPEPRSFSPWLNYLANIFSMRSTGSLNSETAHQCFMIAVSKNTLCLRDELALPSQFAKDNDEDEDIRSDYRVAAVMVQAGCQTVNIVNRVRIPSTMVLLCSTLRHCDALLAARTEDLTRSHGKLLFLRMDAAANDDSAVSPETFQIRADSTSSLSCTQYNIVSPLLLKNEIECLVEFDYGSIFWYIVCRNSVVAELELVIYRIGCPQPISVVSLFGLLPFAGIHNGLVYTWCGPRKISTASCCWIESGLDPDKQSIPMLAMFYHGGVQLLLSWFWEKPGRPTIGAARIKRFELAATHCLDDLPWLRGGEAAD